MGALEKKIAQAETASEVAAAAKEAGQAAVGDKAVELKKKEAYNAKAQRETTKLEAEEAKADQAVLAALRRLVTLNEALKAQEKAFKASCYTRAFCYCTSPISSIWRIPIVTRNFGDE